MFDPAEWPTVPEGIMRQIPDILKPVDTLTTDLPMWFTRQPGYLRLSRNEVITIGAVRFRDRDGVVWNCPAGFPTDGMSYPILVRLLFDRFARRTRRPATTHDFRYAMNDYIRNWPDTRRKADEGLLDGLRLEEWFWARTDYIAVRLGGQGVYDRQSREAAMIQWLDLCDEGYEAIEEYIQEMIEQYGEAAIF